MKVVLTTRMETVLTLPTHLPAATHLITPRLTQKTQKTRCVVSIKCVAIVIGNFDLRGSGLKRVSCAQDVLGNSRMNGSIMYHNSVEMYGRRANRHKYVLVPYVSSCRQLKIIIFDLLYNIRIKPVFSKLLPNVLK